MIDSGAIFTFKGSGKLNLGKKIRIRKGVDIECFDGGIIDICDNFFINKNSSIICRYAIKIGDNCMIGEGVGIYDHDHSFRDGGKPFSEQGYIGAPIIIGDNVWIGHGAFIGKGVNIGDNVVIGAGAIITKDIPANSRAYCHVVLVISPF